MNLHVVFLSIWISPVGLKVQDVRSVDITGLPPAPLLVAWNGCILGTC